MSQSVERWPGGGLEGSCGAGTSAWLRRVGPHQGVELLHAWLSGVAYETHRHDTYTVCVTDRGVQQFDYRGERWNSLPGRVIVLHPDEPHDGRPGGSAGFGYRAAYLEPGLIAAAARAIRGRPTPLPFVQTPVLDSPTLAGALRAVFRGFPAQPEPLALDALAHELARGLIAADPALHGIARQRTCDLPALERARRFLDAARTRIVTSRELETETGHSRYELARQFRHVYGTSPYRYLLMRRLELVRERIASGARLADIAADAGFADQAHLSRQFKAAYGLTPALYRRILRPA